MKFKRGPFCKVNTGSQAKWKIGNTWYKTENG